MEKMFRKEHAVPVICVLFIFLAGLVSFPESRWMSMTVTAGKGGKDDAFGTSVALSGKGDVLVVGAAMANRRKGAAYIFSLKGSEWSEQVLLPEDPGKGTALLEFGYSVAVSDDGKRIVVGSPYDGRKGKWAGAVYVYSKSGSTWKSEVLTASDGNAGDWFGARIDISSDGNTIIIGASRSNRSGNDSGAAYIFTWNGKRWNQTMITSPKPKQDIVFGSDVAISGSGTMVLVGERDGAHLFSLELGKWKNVKFFSVNKRNKNSYYGFSVAISRDGNVTVVGAYLEKNNRKWSGAVYAYRKKGTLWKEYKIVPSDYELSREFGRRIVLSGDGAYLLVGAPGSGIRAKEPSSGAAYVYKWNGRGWTEEKTPGSYQHRDSRFGEDVSLDASGMTVVVSSMHGNDWKGAVYLYKR